MRLLIVGATESWSIETHYLKYLRQMEGLTVEVVSSSEIAKPYQTLIYKVINRLSPNYNPYHQTVNQSLLQRAQLFRPDAILVFKGMEIYPQTLLQLRSLGIKLVNYNPDHPFLFVSRGSGNKNVRDNVGNYDLHLCYSLQIKQQIEKEYGLKAIHLPFGFELPEEDFKRVEREEELLKTCFIGNPDATRVQYLQYLLKNGLPVDVYGHNWAKHIREKKNSLLTIYPAVYGLEFWRTVRKYRVQLNIFREHNAGSHNMRTFEIPAVGGVQLAPFSSEHTDFFKENEEIFFYQSLEGLEEKIKFLLHTPISDMEAIRTQARKRSLVSAYSYEARAMQVYEILLGLCNNNC
jgi:spore maturation protein CgeB